MSKRRLIDIKTMAEKYGCSVHEIAGAIAWD
ncbi:hypothetical protein SAMN05216573_12252 [Bradyrhizobium sp. Rc3b]|nr:hypothetical protein SAMN05216573_12252 [Bradyrhizobium sp. Rc3b]